MFELISLEEFNKTNKSVVAKTLVEMAIRRESESKSSMGIIINQYRMTIVNTQKLKEALAMLEATLYLNEPGSSRLQFVTS
jgi:hypothetical protein